MKKTRWHVRIVIVLITIQALVWYVFFHEHNGGLLNIYFLDIGQGDGILIETPNKNRIMIDGGPDSKVVRKLGEILSFYTKSLDALLVTNPDQDHLAGFVHIAQVFSINSIIEPGTISKSELYRTWSNLVEEKSIRKIYAKRGMEIVLDTDVVLTILFPDRDVSALKTNDGSVVAKLTYKDVSVLFTGDAPQAIERYLADLDRDYLKSDVLKVGHHGSHTSTHGDFLKTVGPAYAIISSGKDNKYGHPRKEVLDTLHTAGVEVFNTGQMGTVTFWTDGTSYGFRKK